MTVGQFTVADLEAMPDDGNRYELIDGTIIVSPMPGLRHQVALFELAIALEHACPKHLLVIVGPFAVRPSSTMELQPDVLWHAGRN